MGAHQIRKTGQHLAILLLKKHIRIDSFILLSATDLRAVGLCVPDPGFSHAAKQAKLQARGALWGWRSSEPGTEAKMLTKNQIHHISHLGHAQNEQLCRNSYAGRRIGVLQTGPLWLPKHSSFWVYTRSSWGRTLRGAPLSSPLKPSHHQSPDLISPWATVWFSAGPASGYG